MNTQPALFTNDGPPDANILLDLWLDVRSDADRDPIGLKGEPSYRYFWATWLKYLKDLKGDDRQPAPIEWYEATPETIIHFLQAGPSARKKNTNVSDITRRRYWRLLERIYQFAVDNAWIDVNPANELNKDEKPPSEDPLASSMTPAVWRAMESLIVPPETDDPLKLRDYALFLTLSELGLMPMEVRMLPLDAVIRNQMKDGTQYIHALQIDGPGPKQRRRMVVSNRLATAIEMWLLVRNEVAKSPNTKTLFCTGKGSGVMSADMLLLLAKDLILRAAALASQPAPIRLGPQLIRNTRLVMWLNEGTPSAEVAMRAGLKNTKGLHHLRELLNPEIRSRLRDPRDDE